MNVFKGKDSPNRWGQYNAAMWRKFVRSVGILWFCPHESEGKDARPGLARRASGMVGIVVGVSVRQRSLATHLAF